MKRSPLVLLVVALLAVAAFTIAPTQRPAAADDDRHEKHEKSEALHEAMETLAKNYRYVRRQAGDASKNADTAERLSKMGEAAHIAKMHLPETASTEDLKKSYRIMMNKLIIAFAEGENAALQGDQEKLGQSIDAMGTLKEMGHEKFLAEDDD